MHLEKCVLLLLELKSQEILCEHTNSQWDMFYFKLKLFLSFNLFKRRINYICKSAQYFTFLTILKRMYLYNSNEN